MIDALLAALERADLDAGVRVVAVRGQPGLLCGDGSGTSCSRRRSHARAKPPGGAAFRAGLLAHAAAPKPIVRSCRAARSPEAVASRRRAISFWRRSPRSSDIRRCNAALCRDRHDDAAARVGEKIAFDLAAPVD